VGTRNCAPILKRATYFLSQHEDLMISQSVLFVCHGVLRNAETYCRNWIPIAERFNLMIVCPEFTQEDFPETKYNYGAVAKGKGMKTWAFTSIEYIFDTFVLAGMKKDGYSLFGHSAGAQFAHRFCLFSARASRCLQIVSGTPCHVPLLKCFKRLCHISHCTLVC